MRSSWAARMPLLALLVAAPAHAAWQSFQASASGLSDNNILSISERPAGGIWLGTAAPAASLFDGVRWLTVTSHLPNGRVSAVLEDGAGRQWFGTNLGGLAMFDGRNWHQFGRATGQLPSDAVTAILLDRQGDVWFGTSGGLARFAPATNTWTTFVAGPGQLVDPTITRLFEDSRSGLWVATTHGVSVLDPTRTTWTSYSKTNSSLAQDTVTAVCEDLQGHMWLGTTDGVYVSGAGKLAHLAPIPGLPGNLVLAIARDSTGRMWLSGSDGVVHTEGKTFRADRLTSEGQLIGPIANLLVDSSGNLWLGGTSNALYFGWISRGLFRFDGTGWRNYFAAGASLCPPGSSTNIPALNVLGSNCLETGFQDGAGNLWFSAHGQGLSRMDSNGTWTPIHRSVTTVVSDSVTCVVEDRTGTLWFGSSNAGISSFNQLNSTWTAYTSAEGVASNDVRTLFVDSRGALWVGTGAGVSVLSAGAWTSYLTGGLPTELQRITEDRAGRVWLQTSAGLFSVDSPGASPRAWTTADGLPADVVRSVLATRDGSVWFGTPNGVARLTAGNWTTWNTLGTPGDGSIQVLREDRNGGVWAGTDIDANHWDGSSWTSYGVPQLAGVPVTDILADSSGTVWVHSGSGTSRFNGRAWKRVSGPGSGMTNDATNSSLEDSQLSLWFTSYSGLAEYQPDRVAPQTVFVNQPPALSASRIAGFVYAAAYGEVADLEYSYSWDAAPYTSWSRENTLNLSGIADGTHTLLVRSRDWVGNVDPTPATYTFEVDATPPQAVISSPRFGDPVRGRVGVIGTASDPRFHDFVVQARPAGAASWTAPGVITLAASATPVTGDTLARWDTTPLADGNWELRLAATDTLGLVGVASIQVIVDNVPPFAYQTSPVQLVAHDGGDVYTTNGEVHAYFPPAAFDADPLVSVDSTAAPAPPDTVAGTAIRVSAAWNIGWTRASLTKSGTLEMRAYAAGSGLAIWRDDGGGKWTRVGGTRLPNGALGMTLAAAGRYALFAQASAPSASGGISPLALTPRAFSPNGHYASREVAIGFALARPGAVTVKIYNRAGRFVRAVVRGMGGESGANLVRWDGRDEDGHVVEPGLYLVTVEALGDTRTETLAVVR